MDTNAYKALSRCCLLYTSSTSSGTAATAGTDYTAAYNDDGNVLITLLKDGALADSTTIYAAYEMCIRDRHNP